MFADEILISISGDMELERNQSVWDIASISDVVKPWILSATWSSFPFDLSGENGL